MAEKILNTRIALKIDTLENWQKSTLPLKKGELAIATVAATAGTGLSEPVCMIKIGEDGVKTFSQLEWNVYAKAADVLSACKTEDGLKAFVNGVIDNAGIATSEAMEALAGRVTTAEADIDALEAKFGADTVALEIEAAINALNLADNYAAKVHKHEIADVNGLADSIAAAKKAGDDAAEALGEYKTLNDAAVKVNSDAIAAIKKDATITTFKGVEEALAGKQAAGNYSEVGHKHEIADVNGLSDAIADAKKAGTDASSAAGQALTDAKAYTDSEMTRLVGDTKVADQITTAITNLDLGNTYDAKGAAAAAETAAKGHADGLNTAMNTRVEALEAIDHEHANKAELDLIATGDKAKWDAMEQNAKDYADDLDEAMDGRVQALEAKFGDGEGNVESQISAAVAAEAKLREEADAELQEQITANDGEIAALQGLVGDKKVSEAIDAAVAAEKTRAEGIEGGLETRLAAVEGDYLKAADKEALQTQINTIMSNPDAEGAINSINEFTQYVKDHGTIAEGMRTDINKNKDDIAAEAQRATGVEEGLDSRLQAVEAKLTDDGAVKSDIDAALTEAKGYTDAEVKKLAEGAVATNAAGITALNGLVGDKKVSEQITDVTNPLDNRIVELEKVDHDHANKSVLDGIEAADITAWDAKVDDVTAAADSGLKATRTGNAIAIEIDDSITFVFDCGNSGVTA